MGLHVKYYLLSDVYNAHYVYIFSELDFLSLLSAQYHYTSMLHSLGTENAVKPTINIPI
jgi:hypothetical protein